MPRWPKRKPGRPKKKILISKPRLIVEVSTEFYEHVRHRAESRGCTIKQWILQAIAEKMAHEDQYK